MREPFSLGPLPVGTAMETVDERVVRASVADIFALVRTVEHWPAYLPHYRFVRFRERARDGGGIVEMSANRPFGLVNWPTWWLSEMQVDPDRPAVRFRHIGGITTRMDVEWAFEALPNNQGTHVRLVHVWDGPRWPLIGVFAATIVIGTASITSSSEPTTRSNIRFTTPSTPYSGFSNTLTAGNPPISVQREWSN